MTVRCNKPYLVTDGRSLCTALRICRSELNFVCVCIRTAVHLLSTSGLDKARTYPIVRKYSRLCPLVGQLGNAGER